MKIIHLVAINIIVYQMTGSAAAVAGLWIIGPLTNIVIIYGVLVILSVAKSFFNPSSTTYITMVVPKDKRKHFNPFHSFTSSGAFIIGPAIGGSHILLISVDMTLWINASFFILSALLLLFLPEVEKIEKDTIPRLTISQVIHDFTTVQKFMKKNMYVSLIYLGFILVMIFTFAMDAQEVVFTQQVIGLSELDYSLLISTTGIGSVVAALILSFVSNKLSLRFMIGSGLVMSAIGYIIYSFSWSFTSIVSGFMLIGFFNVYLNAGIMIFYQNNIPVEIMGRVTSIYQLLQSAVQVVFILTIGFIADIVSLRFTIVTLATTMFIASIVFLYFMMKPSKLKYYEA